MKFLVWLKNAVRWKSFRDAANKNGALAADYLVRLRKSEIKRLELCETYGEYFEPLDEDNENAL